ATVFVLLIAHTLEVLVWSLVYSIVDAAPAGSGLVYFAFVNYTTLGYGDVLPAPDWRLLGPMSAMNGVLLFGWSTAVIVEVLRKTVSSELALRRRYAPFWPQSGCDAMSAPSRTDLSLSQTAGSITHSRLVKVPKPQSVEAMTRSRSPTAATASSI